MKETMKKSTYLSLLIALVAAMFSSCGEDRTYEFLEKTEENQWIYSQMLEEYLWSDRIKEPERSTFFTTPSKFFSSILYSADKASFFTDTISAGNYGMTFAVMRDPIGERPSKVYALVLMVEPGSPADIAGVERGDWISSVGGVSLTTTKYSMLQSGAATRLVTEYIDYDEEKEWYFWCPGDTLQIGASVDYTPRAVYLDSIYTVREKDIAYLVLNNFNGEDFAQRTTDALLRFAAADVDEIVIDLRYCTGGSIDNAALLASAFVAPELYGTPFCNLLDADGEVDTTYCYAQQQTALHKKRLFIITGEGTVGTAELFTVALNNSRSMHDLLIFGAKTSGVNTMTRCIESPYGFAINPATNYVAPVGDTLLEALVPDLPVDELQQIATIYPLGSEQEYVLYNVFYYSAIGDLPSGASDRNGVTLYCRDAKPFVK